MTLKQDDDYRPLPIAYDDTVLTKNIQAKIVPTTPATVDQDVGFKSVAKNSPQVIYVETRYLTIGMFRELDIDESVFPKEVIEQLKAGNKSNRAFQKVKRDKYLQYTAWQMDGYISFIANELGFTYEFLTKLNPNKNKFYLEFVNEIGQLGGAAGAAGGMQLSVYIERVTPLSDTIAHEFGHVWSSQYNDICSLDESFAEWLSQTHLPSYDEYWSHGKLGTMHTMMAHSTYYYEEVYFFEFLHSNLDNIPYPKDMLLKMYQRPDNTTFWNIIKSYVNYKDFINRYLRRYALLDFGKFAPKSYNGVQTYMANIRNTNDDKNAMRFAMRYVKILLKSPDSQNRYIPISSDYPQQTACGIHRVVPKANTFTVKVQGIKNTKWNSDWRMSVVVKRNDGIWYSDVVSNGKEITISDVSKDSECYVVVSATPNNMVDFASAGQVFLNNRPNAFKETSAHPYEITLKDAVPEKPHSLFNNSLAKTTKFEKHPNGGGMVAKTAHVEASAFVDEGCMVLDTAKVLGNARLEGFVTICANAIVKDNAIVSGYSIVRDNAIIGGYARIRDQALVQDAEVTGFARVLEKGTTAKFTLSEKNKNYSIKIYENATIQGFATVHQPSVRGTAVISCDWERTAWEGEDGDDFDPKLRTYYKDITYGHYSGAAVWLGNPEALEYFDYYAKTMKDDEKKFYVIYDFKQVYDDVIMPRYGFVNGIVRNNPKVENNIITLDGVSQYLVFPSSVADIENIMVKVRFVISTHKAQTLFNLGRKGSSIAFSIDIDGRGSLKVGKDMIAVGTMTLSTPYELIINWKVNTRKDSVLTVQLNGQTVSTNKFSYTMDAILGQNYSWSETRNFLGRGESNDCFAGQILFFGIGFSS